MASCHEQQSSCHGSAAGKRDYLLLTCLTLVTLSYLCAMVLSATNAGQSWLGEFTYGVRDLINTMAWGIILGIVFIALIGRVPREFVISILGRNRGVGSLVRATIAGVLLDLCSHGILMVGARLYERGVSTAQVMAFLIASPWNSFSFTLILWAMVGLKWTLVFLILSMLIALVTGFVYQQLETRGVVAANPNTVDIAEDFQFFSEARRGLKRTRITYSFIKETLWNGLKESRMVLRWIFFGVLIAALVRSSLEPQQMQHWFGATLSGLALTLLVATIMEVCSEGTLPVAADLLTRAQAPGNSLAFLMAGVSTDYTEIMVLRETTGAWKVPLLLPLITLPQILLVAVILNSLS